MCIRATPGATERPKGTVNARARAPECQQRKPVKRADFDEYTSDEDEDDMDDGLDSIEELSRARATASTPH